MIPFSNQLRNDSFKEYELFKNFKILEITLSGTCIILCFYFIIASFNGEFSVAAKYELLAREKVLTKEMIEKVVSEVEKKASELENN